MSTASAIFSLIRPVNSIMIGFAVIVGIAVVAPTRIISWESVLGFLTGFLISSYSMTINDYYDVEIDRINAPTRPIPSGTVSTMMAVALATSLLILGLISSLLIGISNLIIAAFFGLLAWSYSYRGKKRGIAGNMMVAASMAVPYVFGGVAIGKGNDPMLWFLAATTFLAGTGREVVKTISDVEGDRTKGVNSIAITRGTKIASKLGAGFFLSAVITSLLPLILGIAGIIYAILVFITDAFFIYLSTKIMRNFSVEGALRVKKMALRGMMLGLLAFLIGGALRF